MSFQAGAAKARELEFEEFYVNSYMRGAVVIPLARSLFLSFGILFYALLFFALTTTLALIPVSYLLGWLNPNARPGDIKENLGFAYAALICLAAAAVYLWQLVGIWTVFLRILRSRVHVLAGLPLSSVEGRATFYLGRYAYRTNLERVDKLDIGEARFDLRACGRLRKLLSVRLLDFVRVEPLTVSGKQGFTVETPLRVWYVPSTGVLVRAELPALSRNDLIRRAQALNRRLTAWFKHNLFTISAKDREKCERLMEELGSLSVQSSPASEHRLAQVEEWLAALGVRDR